MAAAEDVAAMRQAFETQMQMLREENAAQAARLQALQAEGQAQIQLMQAQLDHLQAAGTDVQQRLNMAEAQRSTAEQHLAEERTRGMQTRPLVDISKLGAKTPVVFDNDTKKWA